MTTDTRPQPYSLRLDPRLRHDLETCARKGGRSLHAEIMMRLEASLKEDAHSTSDLTEARIREIVREELANKP